jgi:NDP-sugar pyrophosphorylase family protein
MKLAIIGAGGHAKEVFMSFKKSKLSNDYLFDGFFVEKANLNETLFDYEIKDISLLNPNTHIIHIAVGDLMFRRVYHEKLKKSNFKFLTIIDDTSTISDNVIIEEGAYISPSATINVECKIGKCTIINTGCILTHEVTIGN